MFEATTSESSEGALAGGPPRVAAAPPTAAARPAAAAPRWSTTERPRRSLVKAISWRVTGTLDTMVISYLITGQLKWAVSIGFVEVFTKLALYYLHERTWNRIPFGRVRAPVADYQI